MSHNLTIFVFTYRGDESLIKGCVTNMRWCFPEARIVVADDAANPLTKPVLADGILYVRTNFPRLGNLNGRDCILGELQTFLDYSRPGDLIIKVDTDTMLIDREYMRNLCFSGLLHVGVRTASSIWGGYFYLLTRELVMTVQRAVQSLDLAFFCGEDAVIGGLAYALAPKRAHYLIDNVLQGGPSGAFAPQRPDWDTYWRDAIDGAIALLTVSDPGVDKATSLKIQRFVSTKLMGGQGHA